MNALMNLLSGGNGGSADGMAILMQAVGAFMRGESPHDFLKRLANQHPQLKKVNFNDLAGSAQKLAEENGTTVDAVTEKLKGIVDPMINK